MIQMRAGKRTITNSALRASASTGSALPVPRSHVRRPAGPRAALRVSGPEPAFPVSGPEPAFPVSGPEPAFPVSGPEPAFPVSGPEPARPVPRAPGVDPGLLLILASVWLSLLAELAPRRGVEGGPPPRAV